MNAEFAPGRVGCKRGTEIGVQDRIRPPGVETAIQPLQHRLERLVEPSLVWLLAEVVIERAQVIGPQRLEVRIARQASRPGETFEPVVVRELESRWVEADRDDAKWRFEIATAIAEVEDGDGRGDDIGFVRQFLIVLPGAHNQVIADPRHPQFPRHEPVWQPSR